MRFKILGLFVAVLMMAGCASKPDTTTNTGTGTASQSTAVTPGSEQDLVQNVGDRVFFAYNQSNLSPEARTTLDKQAAWLAQYPSVTLTIEGHTDERGTREYNLALGERRANATKNYLIAKGVSASRLTTISYGKERPAVVGSDESAWAQNRRAVSVVR
jgi:peptidoglycan-associated lipoprotein